VNIDVRADLQPVNRFISALERERTVAMVRGLNRAAEGSRTDGVKHLRPLYSSLKVAKLRARIKVEKANQGKLTSSAKFSNGRITLHGNFGMKPQGDFGVRFGRLPWRVEDPDGVEVTGDMLDRVFRNRLQRGGRPAVLARYGKPRLPITVLLAASLGRAVVDKAILPKLAEAGRQRCVKEYNAQLQRLVLRRGGVL
jgi:hypothetical protein